MIESPKSIIDKIQLSQKTKSQCLAELHADDWKFNGTGQIDSTPVPMVNGSAQMGH